MRISRALFPHILHYVITHLEFDSRFSQFLFHSVLFRFVTRILFYFLFFRFCLFMYALCSFSWNPLETNFTVNKKKIDWKRNINLTTSTDWTKLKCWLNYFKQEKIYMLSFFLFFFCLWVVQSTKMIYFLYDFRFELLNFMFKSTMKMVENWRKQKHIGFKSKQTWHVRHKNIHTNKYTIFFFYSIQKKTTCVIWYSCLKKALF